MYCPFAHLKRSLLCLFIHLTILISIQHRKRRANIQMNSIYHALFDVQDKITWEMVKRLRRSFDSRFRREEKNIVQNNAFFHSRHLLLFDMVCALSNDTSQIMVRSKLWLILPFDIYVITQLSQSIVLRNNQYSIHFCSQSGDGQA